MRPSMAVLAAFIVMCGLFPGVHAADVDNWPQWRGPSLDGTSAAVGLPTEWSREKNIKWKAAMPSWSGSTPAIWGDRIFVTSTSAKGEGEAAPVVRQMGGQRAPDGREILLLCLSKNDGSELWRKRLGDGNVVVGKQNMSSPSPIVDSEHVWVLTGTGVLAAYDHDGGEAWAMNLQERYGKFGLGWGYGATPLLFEDKLIVPILHGMTTDDPSLLIAFDSKSGREVWKIERPTDAVVESPDAYTTPVPLSYGDRTEILISGGDYLTAHDPATGREVWRCAGMNPTKDKYYRTVASPVVAGDVILACAKRGPTIAVRIGGKGDVSETHIAWTSDLAYDVPTPVTDGMYVYIVNDRGFMACVTAETGEVQYQKQRLPRGIYDASPLLADGKIYVTSEKGRTAVLRAGPEFDVIAVNDLEDSYTLSSIAVSGQELFLRTSTQLYCIAEPTTQSTDSATGQAAGANDSARAAADAAAGTDTADAGDLTAGAADAVAASGASQWTSWRGAARDGKVAGFEPPAAWPKELSRGWSVEVGTGHSTPALAGGRLYVNARQKEEELILALDAESGRELWRHGYTVPYEMDPTATEHGKGPKASVTVTDGRVVTFGVDGMLSCLDAESGAVIWQYDGKDFPKPSPRYGVAMTPLVVEGLCVAHVGGDEKGAIRAFDLKTGDVKWSWDGDGPGYASPIVATVDGEKQIITQTRSFAVGLSLADGSEVWKIEFKTNFDQNSVTPIVHDGNVILSGYHVGITAYPLAGGVVEKKDAWSTKRAAMYMSSPVLEGDAMYGFSEKRRGQLFCMDAKTGDILWTGDSREGENVALVDAGEVLFALDTEGELIVLRKTDEDYDEITRYEVATTPTWAHPVIAGRDIYIKDETMLTRWTISETAASDDSELDNEGEE